MSTMRDRLARSGIWTVGALLGAVSTAVLVVAAAVPAILGLVALVLTPIRAVAPHASRSGDRANSV